jgi:hypothetical protein
MAYKNKMMKKTIKPQKIRCEECEEIITDFDLFIKGHECKKCECGKILTKKEKENGYACVPQPDGTRKHIVADNPPPPIVL